MVSFGAIGLSMWASREAAFADAERNNDNMASILVQQASQSVGTIEFVLNELAARATLAAASTDGDMIKAVRTRQTYDLLRERLTHLPEGEVVSILDKSGEYAVSTRGWPTPDVRANQYEVFAYLRDNKTPSLYISQAMANRISGTPTTYFSRRIEDAKGGFLGTATVGVRSEFFMKFYDGISTIPGVFLRLARLDGRIIARYPDAGTLDNIPQGRQWHQIVQQGGGHVRFEGQSHKARLMTVRRLERYPLALNIGVLEASVLDQWRADALRRAAQQSAVAVLVIALICGLYFLYCNASEARQSLAEKTKKLSSANLRFTTLLTNMTQGVAMFDRDNRLVISNARYAELYGLSAEQLCPGMPPGSITRLRIASGTYVGTPEEYLQRNSSYLETGVSEFSSHIDRLNDGRHVLVSRQPMADGGWVTTHEDVTERQAAAAQIEHMAQHDALTGLANRRLFLERLGQALGGGALTQPCAVLLVDLDQFKAVNDTFGHSIGDRLLTEAASRLRRHSEEGDLVARLGGDEFVIWHPMADNDQAEVARLSEALIAAIREPFTIDGRVLKVGVSIGITTTFGQTPDAYTLMRQADLALYQAKEDGRNCARFFVSEMQSRIQARRELAMDLDAALNRDDLEVYYQPIVDAQTLDVVAMEALARWRHPQQGFISPAVFIPLAEENGLIARLGSFVLRQACADAVHWPSQVKVSVNVSASQVARSDLIHTVREALSSSGLPAQRVEIEITESVLLGDDEHHLSVLKSLHDEGIEIALDDFGTGFSSLSYLNRFPLDKIKIDRSFINRLDEDSGAETIIIAVTNIAHAYHARTTAEGVETIEQCRKLQASDVNQMQGYLFGAPRPAREWLFENGKAVLRQAGPALARSA